MGYNRKLNDLFGDSLRPAVFRADDEFNSPTLNLEMVISSRETGYIKTQLFLFEPFSVTDRNFFNVKQEGVSVELGNKPNLEILNWIAGGINFIRFSDFSLSSARQVRNSLFDRNAWTAVWPVNIQFNNYFEKIKLSKGSRLGKETGFWF